MAVCLSIFLFFLSFHLPHSDKLCIFLGRSLLHLPFLTRLFSFLSLSSPILYSIFLIDWLITVWATKEDFCLGWWNLVVVSFNVGVNLAWGFLSSTYIKFSLHCLFPFNTRSLYLCDDMIKRGCILKSCLYAKTSNLDPFIAYVSCR